MSFDLSKDIVIRWENPDASARALFEQAGVAPISESELKSLNLPDHGGGLWPGIARPAAVAGRGDETASASREPWVDANGYKVGYLRALHPERPAVLHYVPNLGDRAVPYNTLELALIEAWTAGGNYVLAMEPHYRDALLTKQEKAVSAWQQLGHTVRWLRENVALFRQPAVPIVTAMVDAGPASAEIANLLYRRNVSPYLTAQVPAPDPAARQVLVAANLKTPTADVVKKILAHAEAGATVVAATPPAQQWWRVEGLKPLKSDTDRDWFTLGRGRVVGYKRPVADPSEFALDVIDVVTHKNRAVRLWNASSVIALATSPPRGAGRVVTLVNYGSPLDIDTQVRVQGHYAKATLIRPDGDPVTLAPAKRGTMTEVQVPSLLRVGVLQFS